MRPSGKNPNLPTKPEVDQRNVYKRLSQKDRGLPSSTIRNTGWTLVVMMYQYEVCKTRTTNICPLNILTSDCVKTYRITYGMTRKLWEQSGLVFF